jgi:hypothetical protein
MGMKRGVDCEGVDKGEGEGVKLGLCVGLGVPLGRHAAAEEAPALLEVPLGHEEQRAAPAAAKVSSRQATGGVPLAQEKPAGHATHESELWALVLPAGQGEQAPAPAPAKVAGGQGMGREEFGGHAAPGGHTRGAVLLLMQYFPAAQAVQAALLLEEVPAGQPEEHRAAPAAAKVPNGQVNGGVPLLQ